MITKTRYARVVFPIHPDRSFTYLIPESLKSRIDLGCEVLVDLGRRKMSGIVVGFDDGPVPGIKEIRDLVCDAPLFSDEMLRLTRWIADYYMCSWGEALKAAIPAGAQSKERKYVKVHRKSLSGLDRHERDIIETLIRRERTSIGYLRRIFPDLDVLAVVKRLEAKNRVSISSSLSKSSLLPSKDKLVTLVDSLDALTQAKKTTKTFPKQSAILEYLEALPTGCATWSELRQSVSAPPSSLRALEKKGIVRTSTVSATKNPMDGFGMSEMPPPVLTHHQSHVLTLIRNHLERKEYRTILLYGVTGSGKTEVYMRGASIAAKLGTQTIVLVPEISLTPQAASRFIARFGGRVAVLHSRLSPRERADVWRNIGDGRFDVIIGARSAVLAPTRRLGLIVVDEEQEPSYKQTDMVPRYNARDVAVMRAKVENCLCVLGSATPSLESFQNAKTGKYDLLILPERVDRRPMPVAEIVDMRTEQDPIFSSTLKEKIEDRIEKGEQAMIFLNRRGYSKFILCRDCGHVKRCPNCSVSLTHHLSKGILLCHYCGHREKTYDTCPRCQSTRLLLKGLGTEKVEKELKKLYPDVRVLRMDSDTTRRKHSHRDIFQAFRRHDADILLGTQMIAKGFDFPGVTLVGVISADTSMNLPDLRSSERTFQLITQVAGRAGRSELGGEVVIQTFSPDLDIIRSAASQKYRDFFEVESAQRSELDYPPFSRIIKITVKSSDSVLAQTTAQKLKRAIQRRTKKNGGKIQVLGPAPAPIFRLKGNYRYGILLKTKEPMIAQKTLEPILAKWPIPRKVRLLVDIDPVGIF